LVFNSSDVEAFSRKAGWAICALAVWIAVGCAQATIAKAEATAWEQGHRVKTRLLSGAEPTADGVRHLVAVHMKLDKGWKTYWRNPGTSGGIPPHFDLSGSSNIAAFSVRYPAPDRFVDDTGTTLGFKDEVIFPIDITVRDPSRPVSLKLNAFFGVCEEICIPVELSKTHVLQPAAFRSLAPQLANALARVPVALEGVTASERSALPRIVALTAHLTGDTPYLIAHAHPGKGGVLEDVLPVPVGDVFMGLPERIGIVERPEGQAVAYRLPLMSKGDAKRLRGGNLDLVVKAGRTATQQTFAIAN
jgi:DsbC/DsbD-like thiol-disulfide interchange protein